jgi:hypothetical protein
MRAVRWGGLSVWAKGSPIFKERIEPLDSLTLDYRNDVEAPSFTTRFPDGVNIWCVTVGVERGEKTVFLVASAAFSDVVFPWFLMYSTVCSQSNAPYFKLDMLDAETQHALSVFKGSSSNRVDEAIKIQETLESLIWPEFEPGVYLALWKDLSGCLECRISKNEITTLLGRPDEIVVADDREMLKYDLGRTFDRTYAKVLHGVSIPYVNWLQVDLKKGLVVQIGIRSSQVAVNVL